MTERSDVRFKLLVVSERLKVAQMKIDRLASKYKVDLNPPKYRVLQGKSLK